MTAPNLLLLFAALELTLGVGIVLGLWILRAHLTVLHDDYGGIEARNLSIESRLDMLMALVLRMVGNDFPPNNHAA